MLIAPEIQYAEINFYATDFTNRYPFMSNYFSFAHWGKFFMRAVY
jgi:hypothetical protein